MKYTQKPVSIFPNNVLLCNPMKHCILLSFHMNINIKCVSNVAILSLSCSWHRHVVASVTWFSSAHHIVTHISSPLSHIGSFFAFSLICFSYINKSFIIKMSCLLPRAKLQKVTFYVKRSYLLPLQTLNCHISWTRHTGFPAFVLN